MKKNLKMFLTAIVILTAFILTSCGSKQLSKIALNENLDDIAFVYQRISLNQRKEFIL